MHAIKLGDHSVIKKHRAGKFLSDLVHGDLTLRLHNSTNFQLHSTIEVLKSKLNIFYPINPGDALTNIIYGDLHPRK